MIITFNPRTSEINRTGNINSNTSYKGQACLVNNVFNKEESNLRLDSSFLNAYLIRQPASGINKKCPISFGSSINGWDIWQIQNLLDKYEYGRDIDFILEEGFDVVPFKNGVKFLFPDFYAKKEKPLKKGLCHNLALEAYNEINDKFKDKYHIQIVEGNSDKYFNKETYQHYFLVAWPKELGKDILYKKPDKNEFSIPDEAIIIDPSFRYVGKGYNYKVKKLSSVSDIEGETYERRLDKGKAVAVPLGYLSKLMPNATCPGDKPILYEVYKNFDGEIRFALGVQYDKNSAVSEVDNWHNIIRSLPSDDKLKRYINTIINVVPPYKTKG